jgi:hypothetical protein
MPRTLSSPPFERGPVPAFKALASRFSGAAGVVFEASDVLDNEFSSGNCAVVFSGTALRMRHDSGGVGKSKLEVFGRAIADASWRGGIVSNKNYESGLRVRVACER